MNKIFNSYKLILPLLLIIIVSCQKTNPVVLNNGTMTNRPGSTLPLVSDTDTSQNIFKITALSSPEPGRIFVSPTPQSIYNTGVIMILDQNGHVIKKKTFGSNAVNFKKWTVNGKVRYSYEQYDLSVARIPGAGYWPGYEVITDTNFNEIDRVYLLANGNISANPNNIDGHDFIYLDDHHYILESFYQKKVNNIPSSADTSGKPMQVIADIIQEINNGSVVWQWDATDYPEFYTTSLEGNQFSDTTLVYDYLHLNSMFVDPRDNNLICSFRNLDQVVKLERGTGKILWRLGGSNSDFSLNADQVFLRQHHVTLTDNNQTLLLFDDGFSGFSGSRAYSRIVEFNISESSKTVLGFKSFTLPETFTQYMGSVQKRGNTYFIGGGTGNYVLEINYQTGEKLLELTGTQNFYRAYKY